MTRLATTDMTSLWQAATGTLMHGPRCTCVGFGMMYRSRAELERDIAEFLIAKYEDLQKSTFAHLFQRWVDEHSADSVPSGYAPETSVRNDGLLEWIDRNAPSMKVTNDELKKIGTDIRDLLQSMAAPASEFDCR